jgi:hypothetical protein
MQPGKRFDHPVPLRREMNFHGTLVFSPFHAGDKPQFLAARHQGNCAMVMGLKLFGQFPDGRPLPAMVALDMQQQQILEMGQAMAMHDFFAETQETPQLIAKVGKGFEFLLVERLFCHGHSVL